VRWIVVLAEPAAGRAEIIKLEKVRRAAWGYPPGVAGV